jgi:hypothetical protein
VEVGAPGGVRDSTPLAGGSSEELRPDGRTDRLKSIATGARGVNYASVSDEDILGI